MNPTTSISTCNSASPERPQNRLLRAGLISALGATLLITLTACGSDSDSTTNAKPGAKPNALEQAGSYSEKAEQTNAAAIGALQRAQAAEQTRLQDAERRRREMEAQGI